MKTSRSARSPLSALCLALSLAGCVNSKTLEPIQLAPAAQPKELPLTLSPAERELLGTRQVDWGLALSGGGLRSAFFSLGVLKALYDDDVLDGVDIISTVSGGGYTGYWLYTNELADHGQASFGASSLSDQAFPRRLCDLITKSNFVPYGRVGRVLAPNLAFRSVALYEQSLGRTFGYDEPADGLSLTRFAPLIRQGEAPYLIQSATIIGPGKNALPWPEKIVEFTPLFYGTSDIGYLGWGSRTGTGPLPMRKTTAVSGAAFSPLKQTLPLLHPKTGATQFTAHDGGQSENLGAMALIRRGVPNVVIADAEHDPVYVFDAYRTLKAGLSLYGLDLRVDEIEDHLERWPHGSYSKAVAKGQVTDRANGQVVSTVYYIKATMPAELSQDLAAERVPSSPGSIFQTRFYAALDATANGSRGAWRCDQLNIPQGSFPTEAWAAFNVASYSDWLSRSMKSRFIRTVSRGAGVRSTRIEFPQYSTADQSFYVDQAQAFAGLGYLEGRRLQLAREPGVH